MRQITNWTIILGVLILCAALFLNGCTWAPPIKCEPGLALAGCHDSRGTDRDIEPTPPERRTPPDKPDKPDKPDHCPKK